MFKAKNRDDVITRQGKYRDRPRYRDKAEVGEETEKIERRLRETKQQRHNRV